MSYLRSVHGTNHHWFAEQRREERDRRRAEERANGFPNSWRVVADGHVISEATTEHGDDWAKRMASCFFEHLVDAKEDPTFEFDGFGGKKTGPEFLRFHSEKTGMPLETIELVPPGEKLPVCPGIIT